MNLLRPVAACAGWSATLLALGLFTGCAINPPLEDPVRYGPYYAPKNVLRDPAMPSYVRRVLQLPVAVSDKAPEETAETFDDAFSQALQRQARFEVVTLSRAECLRRYGVREFSSVTQLPHKFLEKIAADFAVDAVLFVDVTAFRAYRPLAIGLRAKLATTETTRLVWAFDDLISADDPAVANSARHFFLTTDRATVPADLSHAVLQSPGRFAAFVAETAFRTLPPR